jgi:hypothetical protein
MGKKPFDLEEGIVYHSNNCCCCWQKLKANKLLDATNRLKILRLKF